MSKESPINQQVTTFYGQFAIISSNGIILSYCFVNKDLKLGQLIYVPLKQGSQDKLQIAILLNFCEKPIFECRSIHSIVEHSIFLKQEQLELMQRVALYYLTPFEYCIRFLAPGFLWQKNKVPTILKLCEQLKQTETDKNSKLNSNYQDTKKIILNLKQQDVFNFILDNLNDTILFHGVTGSGKTEVYISLAQEIITKGKNCLILVPEISLTPQMSARFKVFFEDKLAILHSGISQSQLIKEWISVYTGHAKVVLGVRSAIFCPLENIGLIIVDEEHDQSYKSSERPCYNARDVAVMRAKLSGACCVLGTATPSLESFWNTKIKKYKYIELTDKYVPSTKVTQLIFETSHNKNTQNSQLAPGILDLIKKNHENNFQTLVLINRRGFVNYALCGVCRTPLNCPHCSIATRIHNHGKREICHYCNFNQEIRTSCPDCGHKDFLFKGIGTQNIESLLQQEIPNIRIDRLDRDNLRNHTKLSKVIHSFSKGEIDCIVGTQIIAKGHDFAKVTLIVILNLEDGLFLPDFRAGEKTFHLLTQAIGRVGRSQYPGVVALQSVIKHHPVIHFALKNEVILFLERELLNRQRAGLPPYSRLILLEIKHKNKLLVETYAQNIKNLCLGFWKNQNYSLTEFFLSGPYDAPIGKINKIHRLHLCIHMPKATHPKQTLPEIIYASSKFKNILKIDVDPQNFI